MLDSASSQSIHAWAALEPRGQLLAHSMTLPALAAGEVEIEVSHCGVCRSDVHLVDNDWGHSSYPLVPGHEIVGEIRRLGAGVHDLAIGQRVGAGWQAGSCGVCRPCQAGDENLCRDQQRTCVGRSGGFAERVRMASGFVYPLAPSLRSDHAAPLLCAGATVFAPLERYAIGPAARVAIIGLGGLGHLGVGFARALGAEVTVFSSSADKSDLARELGATRVVDANDRDALAAERDRHDLILSTVHVDLDWTRYVRALRPTGTLCFLGMPPTKLSLPIGLLVDGQRSVSGSVVASPATIRRTLAAAVSAGITPIIETFAMADAELGLARVRAGKARLRVVLAR